LNLYIFTLNPRRKDRINKLNFNTCLKQSTVVCIVGLYAATALATGLDVLRLVAVLQESVWQMGERTEEASATQAATTATRVKANSAIYSNDATALVAQVLTPFGQPDDSPRVLCFADLPAELQQVLQIELNQTGAVSSIIETPAGYLIYVARAISADSLTIATLTIPRRSYEEWLSQQSISTL
jgi:hypothetical protein